MSICCIRRNERRIIIADKHDIIFHNGKVRVILFVQIQDAVCRIVIHGSVFEVLNVLRIGRAGELVAQRGVLDGVKQERLYHEAVGDAAGQRDSCSRAAGVILRHKCRGSAAGRHELLRIVRVERHYDVSVFRDILHGGCAAIHCDADDAILRTGSTVLFIDAVHQQLAEAVGGFHRHIRGVYGRLRLLRRGILALQQRVGDDGLDSLIVQPRGFLCRSKSFRDCTRTLCKGAERYDADQHGEGQQSRK